MWDKDRNQKNLPPINYDGNARNVWLYLTCIILTKVYALLKIPLIFKY